MTPEQQIEVIKARAEGKLIRYSVYPGFLGWYDMTGGMNFNFVDYEYRIVNKPDVVIERQVIQESGNCIWIGSSNNSNLKLTFDGETGKLKSAEVL